MVAPDIFTQSTLPAFEDFTHEEGGAAASMPSLVYATSDEHINSGFEIIDINIYVPLSLPQLSSYLSIKQSLATSQQGEQQLILQKKLDNMCSALYPNPFILGGDNATGHDSEKHSSLHDALLHNSSKMYLLDKMLSSLEDDGRTVLIMCHSEDIYSILEEYCVLSEKKFMRVRSANAVVQKLDALYLNSVSKDVFVYLLVVDDCEPGVDFDVPAVDTVLIFDSYSTNIETHILRLINNIRRCNPLVIYKLFSDLAEDHILPKFPFMCDSRDNKSEYEIFSADTGICSADISILMSVKEDVQSVDSKSVATSTWIRSKLPGDVKLRQLFSRLKGVFVDRSKVKSTSIDSKTSLVPRSWLNLPFCCLCGSHELPYGQKCIENKYNTQRLMNCKLCPRSFHRKCFEDSSLPQKELVLVENVCPQHVCACGANAGVMCPCAHCLTVFCERCVPLRDVEPLGRRTEITKECDFYCQTYYYICCDYCAQVRNSEYLNESDRSSIGFYFLSEKESKQKVAAGEQAAPNGLCVREKLIILPTQLTVCHNTEAEFSKKRKREIEECPLVEDYSSDGGKSDYDEEVSVDTIPGSMGFYVSLTVDEKIIYALNKKSTDSNLAMQFIDIILSGDESHAVYADPKKYSLAVSAYVSKNNKDDTKINCSAYDEVIGALYLGYKYICFDVISIAAPVKRSKMRS